MEKSKVKIGNVTTTRTITIIWFMFVISIIVDKCWHWIWCHQTHPPYTATMDEPHGMPNAVISAFYRKFPLLETHWDQENFQTGVSYYCKKTSSLVKIGEWKSVHYIRKFHISGFGISGHSCTSLSCLFHVVVFGIIDWM